MVVLEAAFFLSSVYPSSSFKLLSSPRPPPLSMKLHISNSTHLLTHNFPPSPLAHNHISTSKLCFELCSTIQETAVETVPEETQEVNQKRKLYVVNLPWSLSVVDIKNLFGQCGTVSDVEIIKQKNGRSRGFAFVTMSSGEEAQAVVDKFDSHEVSGRLIRVEFAKRFKRPSPPPSANIPTVETRHKLYVSNLAWKVRTTHLREFFSANFNPVSTRVIFNSPTGRSSGYGFVSFATKEEAEAAILALDGKEIMGRPLRLKFSERKVDELGSKEQEEESSEGQPEE